MVQFCSATPERSPPPHRSIITPPFTGLTAVAEVVLRSEPNVLLIPLQALQDNLDQPMVLAWEEGVIVEKLITTGNSDGFWVVVESGLSEGDVIVDSLVTSHGRGNWK